MSKAADRSSKMSTEDLEAALASLRASVTESRAVSVEWLLLKPDWLLSRRLFCARNSEIWLNCKKFQLFFLSCGLNVNIFYVRYLTQDSTK